MKSERDDIKLELITEEELNEIKESSEYVNLLLTNRLKYSLYLSHTFLSVYK